MVENDSDNTTHHITDKHRAHNNTKQASLQKNENMITTGEMETPQPEGCLKSGVGPGESTSCYLQVTRHLYTERFARQRHKDKH